MVCLRVLSMSLNFTTEKLPRNRHLIIPVFRLSVDAWSLFPLHLYYTPTMRDCRPREVLIRQPCVAFMETHPYAARAPGKGACNAGPRT